MIRRSVESDLKLSSRHLLRSDHFSSNVEAICVFHYRSAQSSRWLLAQTTRIAVASRSEPKKCINSYATVHKSLLPYAALARRLPACVPAICRVVIDSGFALVNVFSVREISIWLHVKREHSRYESARLIRWPG